MRAIPGAVAPTTDSSVLPDAAHRSPAWRRRTWLALRAEVAIDRTRNPQIVAETLGAVRVDDVEGPGLVTVAATVVGRFTNAREAVRTIRRRAERHADSIYGPEFFVVRVGWAPLGEVLGGELSWQWDEVEHDCRDHALSIRYGMPAHGPSPDDDFVIGGCISMDVSRQCAVCGGRW